MRASRSRSIIAGSWSAPRRKYDTRLLLAHIARLDKAAEDQAAQADAGRFDELLARIAGEDLPVDMESEDGVLPLDGPAVAQRCAAELAYTMALNHEEERDPAARAARNDEAVIACEAAQASRQTRLDAWVLDACGRVDQTTGWNDQPPVPGLPGGPPLPRIPECENEGRVFSPRTLSEVSTGALVRALAGPVRGFVAPASPRSVRQAMA